MPLRDYQQDAVNELRASIARSGSAVYVLPTGGGKTVVAGEIARLAAGKSSRTLVSGPPAGVGQAGGRYLAGAMPRHQHRGRMPRLAAMPWAPLQVGMVQSVARRERVGKPDLVVIDEAHHARAKTWEMVLARWPHAKRIGLTATPERLGREGIGRTLRRDGHGANHP